MDVWDILETAAVGFVVVGIWTPVPTRRAGPKTMLERKTARAGPKTMLERKTARAGPKTMLELLLLLPAIFDSSPVVTSLHLAGDTAAASASAAAASAAVVAAVVAAEVAAGTLQADSTFLV